MRSVTMGMTVPMSAFLFLVTAVTLQTILAEDVQCTGDNKKICPETGKCGTSCENEDKSASRRRRSDIKQPVIDSKVESAVDVVVVPDLVNDDTSVQFTLGDLMAAIDPERMSAKLDCPRVRSLAVYVTMGDQTIQITPDTVINFNHPINVSITAPRISAEHAIYQCRGTTEQGEKTTNPKDFLLVAAILPPLKKAVLTPQNVTLPKEGKAFRFLSSELITVNMPPFLDDYIDQIRKEINDSKPLRDSKAMAAVIGKFMKVVRDYKDDVSHLEIMIRKPKAQADFDIKVFNGKDPRSIIDERINLGNTPNIYIFKDEDFQGRISFQVTPLSQFVSVTNPSVNFQVAHINYRPVFKGRNPSSLSKTTNSLEFTSKDVSKMFLDRNPDDDIYSVMLYAVSSSAGVWQFEKSDNSWEDVPIKAAPPTDSFNQTALILDPDNKFRFKPADSLGPMSLKEAIRNTSIFFLATDMHDLQIFRLPHRQALTLKQCEDSLRELCYDGPGTAYSRKAVQLFVSPRCSKDCNNSMVCGKPLSTEPCPPCPAGEVQNKCTKNCFSPQDPALQTEGKDCRGECDIGLYRLYSIPGGEICLRRNLTQEVVDRHVCQDIFEGDINECQKCYGGNTTKTRTEGMDVCGICGGDGTCDISCDGTPNGPKIIDSCGQCVDPQAVAIKSDTPFQLGKIIPDKVVAVGERRFKIDACNINSLKTTPSCSLKKTDRKVSLKVELAKSRLSAKLDMTTVAPGMYSLQCVSMKGQLLPSIGQINVTVFPTPSGLSVAPDSTNTNTGVNVTLCGSDLQSDTGKLKCAMNCPFPPTSKSAQTRCVHNDGIPMIIMDASIGQRSCIICHSADLFTRISHPGKHRITALLDWQMQFSFKKLSRPEFTFIAPAPQLKRVVADGFCKLTLHFDRYVSGSHDPSVVFRPAIGSRIVYQRNKMYILFKDGGPLNPGDTISVLPDSLKQHSNHPDSANANAAFDIVVPQPQVNLPKMELTTSSRGNLTICETKRLRVKTKGFGECITISPQWSVEVTGDADTEFTNKVQSTRKTHLLIKESDLKFGNVYKISVTQMGLTDSITLTRQHEQKAISVKLVVRRKPSPLVGITVKAKVKTPSCGSSSQSVDLGVTKYEFALLNENERVILFNSELDSSTFIIPKGTLTGGRKYYVKVTVYNDESTATDILDLDVPKLDLGMTIKYDSTVKQNTAFEMKADLDDPNNSKDVPVFTWECKEQDNICPRILSEIFKTTADTVSVSAGQMPLGTYLIVVTAQIDGQTIDANATVTCVQDDPPKLRISRPKKTAVNDYVFIKVFVKSHDPINVTFSCSVSDGGIDGDCEDFTAREKVFNKSNIATLIRRKMMFGNPGLYTIHCMATSLLNPNLATSASVKIKVFEIPGLGEITIDPTTGRALNTTFSVSITTDDDGDLLTYQIRYREEGQRRWKEIGVPNTDSTDRQVSLPAGKMELNVKACMEKKCRNRTLTEKVDVAPIPEDETEEILSQLADKDEDEFVDAVNMAFSGDEILSGVLKEKISEAISKIVEGISIDVLEESINTLKHRIVPTIKTNSVDDSTKATVKKSLGPLIRNGRGSSTEESVARRRKRSTEEDELVEAISVEDAEALLDALVSIYNNDTEEDISRADSEDFINDLETIASRLCANDAVVPGNEPLYLNTFDVLLKVDELSVDAVGFNETFHNITCTNSPEFNNDTAEVVYGNSVIDQLSQWNCTDTLTCSSACFVSGMMKKDFLFGGMDTTAKLIYNSSARVSDIYLVKAFNPVQYTELTLPPSEVGMTVAVPVDINSVELTTHTLECNLWVDQEWSAEPCAFIETTESNGETYIVCSCDNFGYLSVMKVYIDESTKNTDFTSSVSESSTPITGSSTISESATSGSESATSGSESATSGSESSTSESESATSGSESATSGSESATSGSESATSGSNSSISVSDRSTSANDSTTSSNGMPTTTQSPVSSAAREIRFKIDGTLSQFTENTTLSDFKAHLKRQIATHLGIAETWIKSLDVSQESVARRKRSTGTIILTFVIEAPLTQELENQLKNDILAGNFTLTDVAGNTINIDPTSFSSRIYVVSTETEKRDKHNLVVIVIGTVVGVLCLLLIIIIILVVLKKKKRGIVDDVRSPSVTPTSSYCDDKQTNKSYIYGVSASPLPEKPGVKTSVGGGNPGYNRAPSTNRPRSDASLSREGTTTSHGSGNESPKNDMPQIG